MKRPRKRPTRGHAPRAADLNRAASRLVGKSIPLSELVGHARSQRTGPLPMGPPASLPVGAPPYRIHDLKRLDAVIHGFLTNLDQMKLRAPEDGARSENTERLRRLLDFRPTRGGPPLGPPVLCGMGPSIGLESLLGFLGSLRKTGILRIHAYGATYLISVVRGDVVHGVSDPRPESELLGNILLGRKAVDADRLSRFFDTCGPSPFRVADAIGREELVQTQELRKALEIQLQLLFDRLLAAEVTEWCFHEGDTTGSYVGLRLNATSVLLESARKRDESGTA